MSAIHHHEAYVLPSPNGPSQSYGRSFGALSSLALAALATGLPVLMHLASRELAMLACITLAIMVATFATSALIIVLIFAYLFQNLFVAFVSPAIESDDQFNAIRAYNFVLTAVAWATLFARYVVLRQEFAQQFQKIIHATTAVLVLVGLYFVLGTLSNPTSAIVYLRNISTPFFLFQIFALVAYQHQLSLKRPILLIALFLVFYGFFEFTAHHTLMSMINGDAYMALRTRHEHESGLWLKRLQETGLVTRSYLDTLQIDFLNTPFTSGLGLQFYRILGPNFHFISFAYAVAFCTILLAAMRHGWYALLSFPLLLILGSKGALTTASFVVMMLFAIRFIPKNIALWSYSILLGCYGALGIAVGIIFQDYHVIGFIGGLRGFLTIPWGRGIGVGGNLSMDMSTIDWSKSQHLGHTDMAVESAIGVLLYQMGVSACILIAILIWIAGKLWRAYEQSGDRFFAVGTFLLLAILVNGIFHEEALFSPLAFGLALGFVGLLLGRAYRLTAPATYPLRSRVRPN